ncbi:MAG TPA: amino acid permease, partial [Gammaproteobacteria bacterium]|nr:amino acid permease [Gammaproteobacteria bacterium]
MFLNVFGIKKVGKVQIVIVSISLTCLISIFLVGFPLVKPEFLTPFLSNGNTGLISTVAFVYISYAGVTKVAAIAGEIKNPDRNLPLAMILSLLTIATVYVLITFVLVGNIPINDLASDIRPVYTVAKIIGGKYFGYIAAAVGTITLMSMANSGVLASSRFPFAMARDRLLPSFLEKLSSKYVTPVGAIVTTCIAMAFVIVFLDVVKIAKLASAFKVLMFISVNLCVIILRETSAQWYRPSYKSPLYPFLQIFGVLSGLVLLVFLGWMPFLAILAVSALGTFLYFLIGKEVMRTGVLRNYGHRPALYLFNKKNKDQAMDQPQEETLSSRLDPKIASDAGAIVPLLGNENSPETLVDIAAA